MPDLDQIDPAMGQHHSPEASGEVVGLHNGEQDREGAMAKADLMKLATYAKKLETQLHENDQLESWVQAKITKAADYIASVYHYLEYEMKFSEYGHHLDNSETLSEGQKMRMKELLAEAKNKVKDIKKAQAEKMKAKEAKKVEEGILTGGECECTECGGTGKVYREPAQVPAHVKAKAEKYNTLVKATKAAHKRMDANHNGIPDDEEAMDEDFDSLKKTGDTTKTSKGATVTKTDTGIKHERPSSSYSDEDGDEKSGKGTKSHAKSMSASEKKERAPAQKKSKTGTWGMENGEKFDNRKVDEAKAKCTCKTNEDTCKVHGKMEESKPSAGLSKAKKSAVVKKAKAGGDIGKPGKSFDKVAKAAGGGKKGEKIAAAAMWKNIKETTAYIEEKKTVEKKAKKDYDGDGKIESNKDEVWGSRAKAAAKSGHPFKESTEFTRMQEQLARLNRAEKPMVAESREVDQIRALTQKLLG
jgi:hypothetical protein